MLIQITFYGYSRREYKSVFKFVREAHHLPLIQVWNPCSSVALWRSIDCYQSFSSHDQLRCDRNMKYLSEFAEIKNFEGVVPSVKYGTGLVGRAFSQTKLCFFRDTSQFSISDYPFVHLTRSSGLAACFAFPLCLCYPYVDDLLLEIFLPPEQNCDEHVEGILKSVLSTVDQGFSWLDNTWRLKQGEEFRFEYAYSGDKGFVYFDIYRSGKNLIGNEGFVSGRETQLFIPSQQVPNTQNRAEISEGVFTNAQAQITSDVLKPCLGGNLEDAAKGLGVSRSTLKRRCRELGITRWPSHKRNRVDFFRTSAKAKSIDTGDKNDHSYSMIDKATYKDDIVMFPLCGNSGIEELRRKLDKRFELKAETERFKIKYEDEGDWILMSCDEDLRFRMDALKSSGQNRMNLSVFPATL